MIPLNKKLATKFRAFARANLPYHYAKRFNKRLFEAKEVQSRTKEGIDDRNFLFNAFTWDETPEGYIFWDDLNFAMLNNDPLPPLPPL